MHLTLESWVFCVRCQLGKVGIPVQRDMLELLFATAMRAGDMTRADQVLDLIQGMGGEMSVRTYRELTIAAVGSGNPARVRDGVVNHAAALRASAQRCVAPPSLTTGCRLLASRSKPLREQPQRQGTPADARGLGGSLRAGHT